MAKRTNPILSESETIIGPGVKIKGTLIGDGDVIIDGHLSGEIKTNGNLTLGINAVIKANVTAANINIAGQLTGNVTCQNETHLTEAGKIVGDIQTGSLQIDAGAIFIGGSHMTATEVHEIRDDETPIEPTPVKPNLTHL